MTAGTSVRGEPAGPLAVVLGLLVADAPGRVMGAPEDQTIDIAMVFWVIQGGGHTILFDSGYHRETWAKQFTIMDYLAPDEAVKAHEILAAGTSLPSPVPSALSRTSPSARSAASARSP